MSPWCGGEDERANWVTSQGYCRLFELFDDDPDDILSNNYLYSPFLKKIFIMRLIAALFLWFVCLSDSFKAPPFLSRKVPPLTRVIRAQPFLSRYAPPLTRAKTLEIGTLRKHKEERRRISPLLVVNGDGETKSDERSSPSSMWPAAVLAISLLLPTVQPASAAYGPSGAAVISPGVVKPINEETYLRLSPKKQRQYENGFLSCFRDDGKICKPTSLVDSLLQQLQNRGETVEEKTETPLIPSDEQIRLEERQKVLRKLGKQPAWVSYVAAAAGSCISTLVMHPLDTLKTRLMSSGGGGIIEGDEDDENSGGGIGSTDEDNGAPLPDVAGLYEGVLPNLFKEAPASAFYLGIYEVARVSLSQYSYFQDHPIVSYLLAGACGELFGSIIRAPAEAVKTRVQTGSGLGEAVSCVVGVEVSDCSGARR